MKGYTIINEEQTTDPVLFVREGLRNEKQRYLREQDGIFEAVHATAEVRPVRVLTAEDLLKEFELDLLAGREVSRDRNYLESTVRTYKDQGFTTEVIRAADAVFLIYREKGNGRRYCECFQELVRSDFDGILDNWSVNQAARGYGFLEQLSRGLVDDMLGIRNPILFKGSAQEPKDEALDPLAVAYFARLVSAYSQRRELLLHRKVDEARAVQPLAREPWKNALDERVKMVSARIKEYEAAFPDVSDKESLRRNLNKDPEINRQVMKQFLG